MDAVSVNLEAAISEAKADALAQFAHASVEAIMLATADRRLQTLEARRKLVLRAFNVTDVAKLGEKLAKNKWAAEKLHELFGGVFEFLKYPDGKPMLEIQVITDDPDVGTYRIYSYYGRYTRPDGKVIEQMGAFSTKDAFFARAHDEWKRPEDVNLVDVMQAAQTETYKKCIFRGVGLGDWTPDEASTLLGTAAGHRFTGSVAGTGEKEAVIGFGSARGQRPAELSDQDLAWYGARYDENLRDPEKAKYHKANERILTAIRAEEARRHGAPVATSTPTAPSPTPGLPPSAEAPSRSRGQRLADLWLRMLDAAGGNQKLGMNLIRLVTRDSGQERTALSELSDAELARLEAATEEDLRALAAKAVR